MAEQLFTTELGYKIENEAGDNVDVILVDGLPGGTTLTDAAAVGSLALSTNGGHYRKATAGSGTDKWESTSSSQAVTDLQNEVDGIEAALGAVVDVNGDYVAHSGTNYIDGNANLTADLIDLDSAIGNVATEVTATQAALGSMVDANGDYVAHTGTNFVDGNSSVTEDITDLDTAVQAVSDAAVQKAGSTMDSAANITFVGGGEVLGLPATPSGDTAATSKAYVDALLAGSTWKDPIAEVNVVDVVATEPTNPAVATGSVLNPSIPFQGDLNIDGTNVADAGGGDVASFAALINAAGISGVTASGATGYLVITSTNASLSITAGSFTDASAILGFAVPVTVNATAGAEVEDAYIVSAAGTWTGIGAVVAGDLVYWDGASWVLVENLSVGDRFVVSGETATTAGSGITGMGFADNALLEVVATGDWLNSASYSEPDGTAGVDMDQGVTVLASDPESPHYGHTYLYDAAANAWIEISGPGSVGAGDGLVYDGNVLNINMGAGIVESPADQVGLDLHANGGLQTTIDGTSADSTAAAQLAVKLADSTLTLSASGLSVSSTITDEIDAIETALGAAVDANGDYVAHTGTNYINSNTSITADLLDLDTAIGNVATDAGNLQTEVDNIEAALGAMVDVNGDFVAFSGTSYLDATADVTAAVIALDTQVGLNTSAISGNTSSIGTVSSELTATQSGAGLDTDGTYIVPVGTNYLDATTSLADADDALDAALKAVSDDVALNATEIGHIQAFIGKTADGAEDPTYTSDTWIAAGANLEEAIGDLDAQIGDMQTAGTIVTPGGTVTAGLTELETHLWNAHKEIVNVSSGVSWTNVDVVACNQVVFVKWLVHIRQGTNVVTWEVDATHDGGNAGTPAPTQVDFTRFAKLKIGTIAGVKIQVILDGFNMRLQVQDTSGTAEVNAVRSVILDQ
jgi:hypothetical protein